MEEDIRRLTAYVKKATEDIESSNREPEGLSEEAGELYRAIRNAMGMMREVYNFTLAMADGNLSAEVPERHNYFAGPSKDLYYKLQHLTWQAEEVAKGDYSQRVDFLGSFSDSFNYMIEELDKREKEIKKNAGEQIRNVREQNEHLEREVELQMLNYRTYRDYVQSFLNFRTSYKKMMGEVYQLFQEGKYDEGRLLIARINDQMASEVIVNKQYSNNEYIDAGMAEIAKECLARQIQFSGSIYIPPDFKINVKALVPQLVGYSALLRSMMNIRTHENKIIHINGGVKNNWLTIYFSYHAEKGVFFPTLEETLPEECLEQLKKVRLSMEEKGYLFRLNYSPERRKIKASFHLSFV